jgi:hypothetical protein
MFAQVNYFDRRRMPRPLLYSIDSDLYQLCQQLILRTKGGRSLYYSHFLEPILRLQILKETLRLYRHL